MKILVGVDRGSYTFNAIGQTITISGVPIFNITQLLLVTNVTNNEIIYSPVIEGKGGTISNNIISLDFDTSSMNNGDILQIFVHLNEVLNVSYPNNDPILDSFGRLSISNPSTIFQSNFALSRDLSIWETIATGGGYTTFNTSSSTLDLVVGPTSGSSVISEQHGYNYYTAGKSQTIFISIVLGQSQSGVTRRVGYYNDTDGVFFEQSNGFLYTGLRSSSSGITIDTLTTQSNWNIDRLDGSYNNYNSSGFLLDTSKIQILFFDFQWLGAGKIRYGFDLDGKIVVANQILNANNISTTYMSSGTLPLRHEILLTSNISGTASLRQVCSTVISGGGETNLSRQRIAAMGNTSRTITSGVRTALMSVRLKSLSSGKINRNIVYPDSFEILTTSNNQIYVELVLQRSNLNETNLGGSPTWNSITGSTVEYSTNGTIVSGGVIIGNGYISSIRRTNFIDLKGADDFICLNSAGTQSDYLHLVVTPIGGNSTMYGSISFRETR